MTTMAKAQMNSSKTTGATRDELLAQLKALDEDDRVAKLEAENAQLRTELAKVIAERNKRDTEAAELGRVIRDAFEPLKPYLESLSDVGRLYRGKRMDPARYQAARASLPRPIQVTPQPEPAQPRVTRAGKPTVAELAQSFPELAGPTDLAPLATKEE